MIFLTVGSEIRFDRLVKAVDEWCATNNTNDVFGQLATPGPDGYSPSHFAWQEFVSPDEYRQYYEEAELIIGHAGMGSIITALVKAKPILVMPRRAAFKETRNDHQVATAKRFSLRKGITVAEDESQVGPLLDKWKNNKEQIEIESAGEYAEECLIDSIRNFILYE